MEPFADREYVEVIRRALWCRREFGRAAVMIGAGFSRNADPVRDSAQPLPLWPDLTRGLVERLGLPPPNTEERKAALARAQETSRALRLAEEFEAAFGRHQLDEWLRGQIIDQDHQPGGLHLPLLRLPWADIFTTNYDTLLERTAPHIVERSYDIVRMPQDVAAAMRPRIIKLHGSLPSNPPFIFTEEDFRTYPRRFAAFMNLAQQAIMENVFCLIGFSGDDPNFLYWTGWVRDNLGDSAPPIYVCGLLNLTNSQRRVLDHRNVTPIDLSPLFPRSKVADDKLRHRLAIEWFLLSLERGRPPDRFSWPLAGPPFTPPSPEMPLDTPPLESPYPQPQPEPWYP
jgi:hypothetical protein